MTSHSGMPSVAVLAVAFLALSVASAAGYGTAVQVLQPLPDTAQQGSNAGITFPVRSSYIRLPDDIMDAMMAANETRNDQPMLSNATYDRMLDVGKHEASVHWTWQTSTQQIHIAVRARTSGILTATFPRVLGVAGNAGGVAYDSTEESGKTISSVYVDDAGSVDVDPSTAHLLRLTRLSGEPVGGFRVLRFSRMLPDGMNRPYPMNVAVGSSLQSLFGGGNNADVLFLNIHFERASSPGPVPDASPPYPWGLFHGWCMLIGWVVLIPAGVIVKRYGKPVFGLGNSIASSAGLGSAFKLHVILMMSGTFLTVFGYALGVPMMTEEHKWLAPKADEGITAMTFNDSTAGVMTFRRPVTCVDVFCPPTDRPTVVKVTTHITFGRVVFSTAMTLPFFGALTPMLAPTQEHRLRPYIGGFHKLLGCVVVIMAYIQCYTGIQKAKPVFGAVGDMMEIMYIVCVSGAGIIILTFELLLQLCYVKRKEQVKAAPDTLSKISWAEVAEHNTPSDPWVVVEGRIFDIKSWMGQHPGGSDVLMEFLGADGTQSFIENYHSEAARAKLRQCYVGDVEDERMVSAIDLVGDIATSMVRMDLEVARGQLTAASEEIPSSLETALENLLHNLNQYIPFLPASLVESDNHSVSEMSGSIRMAPDATAAAVEAHPPTTAAIVFTDIQSSTQLWEAAPSGMKVALSQHNDVMRSVISRSKGYEVKTIGDAFMVMFVSAADALEFALCVQEALVGQEWPLSLSEHPLCKTRVGKSGAQIWGGPRVRIGVHWGEVEPQVNPLTGRLDFFGNTVNKAARVEGVAVGGAVAVTEEVLVEVGAGLTVFGDPTQMALGKVPLKGVTQLSAITMLIPESLQDRKSEVHDAFFSKKSAKPAAMSEKRSHDGNLVRMSTQAMSTSVATIGTVQVKLKFLMGRSSAPRALNNLLSTVLGILQRTDGVAQTVGSGLMTVAWNVSKKVPSHVAQASRFAVMMDADGWGEFGPHTSWGGMLTTGVATGRTVSGKLGTAQQMSVLLLGGVIDLSQALAAAARKVGTFALAATMPGMRGVAEEPMLTDDLRVIDVWRAAGITGKVLRVYELNTVSLNEKMNSWGFSSEAPADTTWGAAFSEMVCDALTGNGGGDAVAKIIREAKENRMCGCSSNVASLACNTCDKGVCTSCAGRSCTQHNVVRNPEGDEVPLKSLLARVQEGASVQAVIDLDLDLSHEPDSAWLGERGGGHLSAPVQKQHEWSDSDVVLSMPA